MVRGKKNDKEGDDLLDKLVGINRVAKVVKGGRRFGFAALVVAGDAKDKLVMVLVRLKKFRGYTEGYR